MKVNYTLGFHTSETGVVSIISNEKDYYALYLKGRKLNVSYSTVSYSTFRRPLGYVKKYLELKRKRQDEKF